MNVTFTILKVYTHNKQLGVVACDINHLPFKTNKMVVRSTTFIDFNQQTMIQFESDYCTYEVEPLKVAPDYKP